jgi:hypothetical protein
VPFRSRPLRPTHSFTQLHTYMIKFSSVFSAFQIQPHLDPSPTPDGAAQTAHSHAETYISCP